MNCGYDWQRVLKNQNRLKMEIGSFIELDLRTTGEYYSGTTNIAKLNSGRTGIFHACRLLGCSSVYIPYYLCPSVRKFLSSKGIIVKSYFISEEFEPSGIQQEPDSAILIVNFFGIISNTFLKRSFLKFKNIIIDNCPAFYNDPLDGCLNIYSPRKFFGVPDGCYVIGENAERF
jgi:hypothetical protein